MCSRSLASICGLILALAVAFPGHAEGLPGDHPRAKVTGIIRVWGSPVDGWLIEELESGFRQHQPRARFQNALHGPESTFGAVYMGVADVGFMAREIRVPLETMGFEWVHHYPPFEVEIANAGLSAHGGAPRHEVELAFFVNRANPLSCLTLRQLDGIFGADHRRGGRSIQDWGELRSAGAWAGRRIHVYGPALGNPSALFVRQAVLGGSRKWNPGYRTMAGGWSEALETLARDPQGITFAPPRPGNQGVKALRVAGSARGRCYPLTAQTVESRKYPLTRTVDVALDRAPGTPIEPRVKEFLRFMLSREGQRIIASDGADLPLSATTLQQQLRRLQ